MPTTSRSLESRPTTSPPTRSSDVAASSAAPATRQRVLILDFGSQYTHLITRRVRELGVYGEALPCWTKEQDAPRAGEGPDGGLIGIILSGGPSSVYDEGAPQVPDWVLQ